MSGEGAIWYHVITVGGLVVFKLAVLVVAYLIARLGHDLLVKGITGEFKFSTQLRGTRADLVSASPGVFFILMATILLAVAILKDKPFETTVSQRLIRSAAERTTEPIEHRAPPVLPEAPPKEKRP